MSIEPDVIRINALKISNGTTATGALEPKTPFLIGVAGGTASGKSTVCKRIMEHLGQADMDHTQRQVVCISQDSFYRELDNAEKAKADKGLFNFDHPSAFNDVQVLQVLQDILAGKKVIVPVYDYKNNAQCPDNQMTIYPADVVLFEGILVFYFPAIRDLFHMKLFVDTDSDTRLSRRVMRDISERGRDLEQVLTQYMTFVKPAFEEFCLPTKKFSDVIIPRGADNNVAIELIVQHIRDFLNNRGRSIETEVTPIVDRDDLDVNSVGTEDASTSKTATPTHGTKMSANHRRYSTLSKNIYLQAQNNVYLRQFSNNSYFDVLDID